MSACASELPDASLPAPSTSAGQSSSGTSGGATTTDATTTLGAPLAVERRTLHLVDATRSTPAAGSEPRVPQRVLETDLYLPDGDGPFPLIVHVHGFSGSPGKFTELLTRWSEAGFVVAAPRFPRTSDTGPGTAGIADYVDQPADVSFVIDELLADTAIAARVDAQRIGVAGLSLGGGTVYGLVWHECCRDARIDAAIVMSSLRFPFGPADFGVNEIPVMIMHGDQDLALPYADAVASYRSSAPPKWFVHLIGGTHSEPYENRVSPHDAIVTDVTTAFWALTLGGDPSAAARLRSVGNAAGLSTVIAAP
jgi:predicted dienelactone hydrolase